jgi:hypothetical protein
VPPTEAAFSQGLFFRWVGAERIAPHKDRH